MKTSPLHFMIVAGEASGDMHAAHLVSAIKALNPGVTFSGLGGQEMKDAGVEIYEDFTRLAVVGFVEVLKHYGEFRRCFDLVLAKARETRPRAVILVDYPGFNLRLAPELKKLGLKVFYYISPQVWAWKADRVEAIKKFTDKMLVLFQFEKDFYAKYGMDVDFVGHPLADMVHVTVPRETWLADMGLDSRATTIGILPGSRRREIQTLLPVMLDAARILHRENPRTQFLLLKAPTIPKDFLQSFLQNNALPLTVSENNFYDALNACDVCLVASGTATLETALLNKPMVVIYKTSFLTWALARMLIKIPYIGLVNVVAGKKIVPECVQFDATGNKIAAELSKIYRNPAEMARTQEDLQKVKGSLSSGAGRRAAEVILQNL